MSGADRFVLFLDGIAFGLVVAGLVALVNTVRRRRRRRRSYPITAMRERRLWVVDNDRER